MFIRVRNTYCITLLHPIQIRVSKQYINWRHIKYNYVLKGIEIAYYANTVTQPRSLRNCTTFQPSEGEQSFSDFVFWQTK